MLSRTKLIITSADEPRRQIVLREGKPLTLGRGRGVDVLLDDPNASRRHLQVELRRGQVWVRDLESRNGTWIEGRRIDPNVDVLLGTASARIGDHELRPRGGGSSKASSGMLPGLAFLPPGEFELMGQMGQGSLATVWAARRCADDRPVAIKVLRTRANANMAGTDRFLREGRLYQQIRSPYVVELYDFRVSHGQPYLILELVAGPTLAARLRGGNLSIQEALKYAEDVARGLADMHAAGILHRDVKPSNVLIGDGGVAKLADLGLAKKLEGSSFTQTGIGLGSLPFVAPEQATGAREVGPAVDLYALGATLFMLIARRPPLILRETSILARVKRIEREPPPLLIDLRADCPRAVAVLVQQLLQKDPAQRPPSAAQVASELARIRAEQYPGWRFDPDAILSETWSD